jgi:hypothetical protein
MRFHGQNQNFAAASGFAANKADVIGRCEFFKNKIYQQQAGALFDALFVLQAMHLQVA